MLSVDVFWPSRHLATSPSRHLACNKTLQTTSYYDHASSLRVLCIPQGRVLNAHFEIDFLATTVLASLPCSLLYIIASGYAALGHKYNTRLSFFCDPSSSSECVDAASDTSMPVTIDVVAACCPRDEVTHFWYIMSACSASSEEPP
jgi:hypothetical protein